MIDTTVDELAARVRRVLAGSAKVAPRIMLGLCGAPGSGKSTLAAALVERLGAETAVIVPMDGFHLATDLIRGTPLAEHRGAIDTFDPGSYLSLLRRLRARDEDVVYAPSFRRGLEEPIAASIAIPRSVPVVITEGNYLLTDAPVWLEPARRTRHRLVRGHARRRAAAATDRPARALRARPGGCRGVRRRK
ncbi:nucleoside/nucleotide kinase family protein [Cryobacterium breve]|uniref:nucleoside/nucleotide kinase family protein n=1 Tax=Cryobacterium breve TaxID=1259258 RepID=UPI00248CE827|nr:nucleoside/nucleotide kinase family protein [Cryobacterium breve]